MNVSIMSYKIFMNFVIILKLLRIFEVVIKKIHINYKMCPHTLIFLLYGQITMSNIMADENHLLI
jgi:hypothetical protein